MTRDPVRISVDRDMRDVMSLMHTQHVRLYRITDTLGPFLESSLWMILLHCLETKSLKWGTWFRKVSA